MQVNRPNLKIRGDVCSDIQGSLGPQGQTRRRSRKAVGFTAYWVYVFRSSHKWGAGREDTFEHPWECVLRHPRKFGASGPDPTAKSEGDRLYCVLGVYFSIIAHESVGAWLMASGNLGLNKGQGRR